MGGGGARQTRRGPPHYYWEPASQTFYMLYLYAKNEQGDLTADQLKVLAKLVRREFS